MRIVILGLVQVTLVAGYAAQTPSAAQQPARDTTAQKQRAGEPTALIAGRVLAADTGRPLRRAHVVATAPELPGGRGFLTGDTGSFEIAGLPAGRYTVTVTLAGFVPLSFGQRRPLQPGTLIDVGDGQQVRGIEFRLPRGSVIGGRVFDDGGDPVVGASVRVLRYQLQQGERRLFPAGAAQTDDRGVFRIWGLNPGEYYVDAAARMPTVAPGGAAGPGDGSEDHRSFAPTYYPGTTSPSEARAVTAGIGQERLDVDFSLEVVPVARVSGRVINPNGYPTSRGAVTLAPDTQAGGLAVSYSGAVRADGAFEIANVPPGSYIVQARGNDNSTPDFARERLSVNGTAVTGVQVVLGRGAAITGTIVFLGASRPPVLSQIRMSAAPAEPSLVGGPVATVDADGDFVMVGVQPGYRVFRPTAEIPGWMLQSVVVEGRDITDTPVEISAGKSLDDVVVTFTDKAAEIAGTITTDRGEAVTDYTILAFPTDASLWRPLSRHILTARPDQHGAFRIRGLPTGTYSIAVVDPVEPGAWFDPAYLEQRRAGATRITIGAGETKTQDFRVTAR